MGLDQYIYRTRNAKGEVPALEIDTEGRPCTEELLLHYKTQLELATADNNKIFMAIYKSYVDNGTKYLDATNRGNAGERVHLKFAYFGSNGNLNAYMHRLYESLNNGKYLECYDDDIFVLTKELVERIAQDHREQLDGKDTMKKFAHECWDDKESSEHLIWKLETSHEAFSSLLTEVDWNKDIVYYWEN